MDKILSGVVEFHESITPDQMPEFARLVAEGQTPRALFITCADSRIVPNTLTSTDPGDLFLIRNIGNLVPPYALIEAGGADTSVAAAIEYSLTVLNIRNIILCGHTDCGAMKAVRCFRSLPEGTPLRHWLSHADAALTQLLEGKAIDETMSEPNQLAQLNVLAQLAHLKEYPWVRERLANGTLTLHAWFLDIEHAEVQVFHPGRNRFIRVDSEVIQELRFLDRIFAKSPEIRMSLHDPREFEFEG